MNRILMVLVLFILSVGLACEEEFQPVLEDAGFAFSIYGYLDASADTQWVRVMPISMVLNEIHEEIDAVVTLQDLETGEMVIMNDSLFQPSEERTYWNFWTTMDLKPEGSYRFVATRSDGEESSATVTLPGEFPVPILRIPGGINNNPYVKLENVTENILIVHAGSDWLIRNEDRNSLRVHSFSYLEGVYQNSAASYRFQLDVENEVGVISSFYDGINSTVLERQLFVAIGGPDWIDFTEYSDDEIAIPEALSNIDNGIGYLGGIFSRVVPYMQCEDEFGEEMACEAVPTVR